jgi:NDP-sugar pyrophosphorylase family protein
MQVIILAGGLGTRLASAAGGRPKSLVPVAGRPFIDHQLELLSINGLRDVLLCVGYLGEMIEEHVGDGGSFGMRVRYSWEEAGQLLGTGGALVNALPHLECAFLVLYGDAYLPADYRAVIRAFEEGRRRLLMCVYRNEGRWDTSNVRVEGDRVVFYSKSAGPGEADSIDYGLSAYRRSVIEEYRDATLPLDLSLVQQEMVRRGEMGAFVVPGRFYEIGKPEGLAELNALLSEKGSITGSRAR